MAALHCSYGTVLHSLGETAQARQEAERAVVISELTLGPEHPQTRLFRTSLRSFDDPLTRTCAPDDEAFSARGEGAADRVDDSGHELPPGSRRVAVGADHPLVDRPGRTTSTCSWTANRVGSRLVYLSLSGSSPCGMSPHSRAHTKERARPSM